MSSSGAGSKRNRASDEDHGKSHQLSLAVKQPSYSVITKEMCHYCLHVLHNYLHRMDSNHTPNSFPNHAYPLFVTWKTHDQNLRGCIGTFNPTRLHDGLREYAIKSATEDERFGPIMMNEFKNLHCSVSILLNFQPGSRYDDWEIGVHGIRINYKSGNRTYSATYLPQVAKEQGWNHETTIDSLLKKAGFSEPINQTVRNNVRLTRYQSEHMTVPAAEYLSAVEMGALRL